MSGALVELEVDGGLARLWLTRDEARNAIDPAMVRGLGDAVTACAAHRGIRCLLICAQGETFSVGGDLDHVHATRDRMAHELGELIGDYHRTLLRLAGLPLPVVCAVRGAAAGGALGLLWCSDVVIAAAGTRFTGGFARLGLSGDGASTWFLPQLVGLRRALELTLDSRVLSAEEAAEWGLITRVVAPEELDAEAEATARRYAAGPTVAFGHQRRLLRTAWTSGLEQQLEAERRAMIACGGTADAREGVEAFVSRRPAHFEGR